VEVDVSGDKAPHEPSRVERLHIAVAFRGDFDEATREALLHEAETICTISNTLKVAPTFQISVEPWATRFRLSWRCVHANPRQEIPTGKRKPMAYGAARMENCSARRAGQG
jgi:hypothetical protein